MERRMGGMLSSVIIQLVTETCVILYIINMSFVEKYAVLYITILQLLFSLLIK